MKALTLIDRQITIKNGKYVAIIKVMEVSKNNKFPDGIKAKFVLQDIELGFARLLVDNHQPFGFHMHTKMPQEKDHREVLESTNYSEALDMFFEEVERIVKNEEE